MGAINALIYVCLTSVWINIYSADCYGIDDVRNLKDELLKNRRYDATIRPLVNQSQPIQVNISMALSSIYDIDLNDGKMKTGGYLTLTWMDENLIWNSSHYGGLSKISIPSVEIWKPNLIQFYDMSASFPYSMTWVVSNGLVIWLAAGDIITMCDLDMRFYPLDKHNCDVSFSSSVADGLELKFISTHDVIDTHTYNPNGIWDLIGTETGIVEYEEASAGIPYSIFYIKISIQRRPHFIILHTYIPLSFLLYLNMFVYFVPLQGGERVTYSVTLFLTLMFYSTEVSDNLPQTSTYVSWMSINLITSMTISGLGVVASIVLCKLAEDSNKQIQPWLQKLTSIIIRFKYRNKERPGVEYSNDVASDTLTNAVDLKSGKGSNNNSAAESSFVSPNVKFVDHGLVEEELNLTWKIVADTLDYALLRVSITFTAVLSITSFVVLLISI